MANNTNVSPTPPPLTTPMLSGASVAQAMQATVDQANAIDEQSGDTNAQPSANTPTVPDLGLPTTPWVAFFNNVGVAIANSVPGAPDTSVQFNKSGRFGGDNNLKWDGVLNGLEIQGGLPITMADPPGNFVVFNADRYQYQNVAGDFTLATALSFVMQQTGAIAQQIGLLSHGAFFPTAGQITIYNTAGVTLVQLDGNGAVIKSASGNSATLSPTTLTLSPLSGALVVLDGGTGLAMLNAAGDLAALDGKSLALTQFGASVPNVKILSHGSPSTGAGQITITDTSNNELVRLDGAGIQVRTNAAGVQTFITLLGSITTQTSTGFFIFDLNGVGSNGILSLANGTGAGGFDGLGTNVRANGGTGALTSTGAITFAGLGGGGTRVVLTSNAGVLSNLAGLTVVINTAKLTGGGANGTMTFTNGVLTAQVQAT